MCTTSSESTAQNLRSMPIRQKVLFAVPLRAEVLLLLVASGDNAAIRKLQQLQPCSSAIISCSFMQLIFPLLMLLPMVLLMVAEVSFIIVCSAVQQLCYAPLVMSASRLAHLHAVIFHHAVACQSICAADGDSSEACPKLYTCSTSSCTFCTTCYLHFRGYGSPFVQRMVPFLLTLNEGLHKL